MGYCTPAVLAGTFPFTPLGFLPPCSQTAPHVEGIARPQGR